MLSFILVWLRKETFLPHPLAAYYNPPFHTAPQSTLLVAGWLLLFSPLLFLHYILWSNPAPLGRDDVQEVAKAMMLSHVQLFVTPWTITQQVPLSMEFSRQKYWSRLPFPSPGDLPNPGLHLLWLLLGRQILYHCIQIPLSMGFSRQEYQNGLSFPYWGDLPNRGIEPRSPSLHQVWATREAHIFKNDALKSWLSHWMCINRAYHLWAFTVWQSSDVMNPR